MTEQMFQDYDNIDRKDVLKTILCPNLEHPNIRINRMTMQKAQQAETTTAITFISPVVEISLELLFSTKIDFLLDIKSYFQENYVDKNRITATILSI